MKKIVPILTLLFANTVLFAQISSQKISSAKNNSYDLFFQNAYSQFPSVPKGMLEAVAFTMTRIHHIDSISNPESCIGMPRVYGVMGLTLDGKNYFRNNLNYVSQLSNYSVNDIISSPEINILAFAKAYSILLNNNGISPTNIEEHVPVLVALSELSDSNLQSNFALNSHLYSVFTFLNSPQMQTEYGFPNYNINFENIFGEENLKVLSAPNVIISNDSVFDKNGNQFQKKSSNHIPVIFSSDYGPAIWNPTTCNYSSRNGTAISAITIHDVEGSYAGCISWFKNCSSSVSAHYVLRSSDGQITQMVLESNKAWHVGSENPYTIGFEHEGYVNQTGWYTVAMYTASAGLARDICNSGYGINPLRTGFQPWMSTTYYNQSGIPGSCVRIKGHMHYPNQTHSDPGPNWNWRYYYNLINNNPSVTTLTTATGTFFDSGGSGGNYTDDEDLVWTINPSGATSVTVTFSSFNVENTWDYLYVYDGADIWANLIGTYTGTTSPGTISSSGGALTFQFISDCSTTAAGWNASWTSSGNAVVPTNLSANVSACPSNVITLNWNNSGTGWYVDVSDDVNFTNFYNKNVDGLTSTNCPTGFCDYPNCQQTLILQPSTTYYWRIWNGSSHTDGQSFNTNNCDNTPPTTQISPVNNWETQNFTANFTDADNVSVAEKFWQVLDWNGTEWRANGQNGFFNDNFDNAINAEWTPSDSGVWAISSGYMNQSDEVNTNTNIYTSVNQNSSYSYLYHWQMKIGGSGTNRRAGIHFFSDNSTLPNRGNSYFVWFRLDNQKAQIYKVANDVFTLETDVVYPFSANTFYDFKTTYNPQNGEIRIYVNNIFVSSWIDSSPFQSGNSMSLRTGNANVSYNDLKIYRSRNSSETVTIGNSSADVRYQNPNPSTPSCRIKSIVKDNSDNWSTPATLNVNIDWTPPSDVAVNDGSSNDIDTTNIATELTANWTTSIDTHSAIATYWYAIGTSQGAQDVVNWVNYGNNTSVTHTGLSLSYNTTYYFTVQVEDGAGLLSNEIYSDGQILVQPLPPPTANFTAANNIVCNGETINFQNTSIDATNYEWTFQNGNPATSTASNPSVTYTASGNYSVTLIAYSNGNTSDTLTQNISVTVNSSPASTFSADSTIVYMPNATVNFTNSSTNSTSWNWDFGDGNFSAQQSPSHTYSDTGYYSVTLISSNSLCADDTLVMTNYIYVAPDPSITAPTASFQYSGSGFICSGDSVMFFNSSSNANSYEWIFSGGNPSTSNLTNPTVLFSSSGNYAVTLIATGPGGVDTLLQNITVNVVTPPTADFSANDTIAYLPNATIDFVNLSDDATNYEWNFGDGSSTTLTDPSHNFTDTGYYTITLIAGNDNCPNDTNIFFNYIYVATPIPAPVAAFTSSSTTICPNDAINFTNNSSDATSFEWNFSGGNPSASTLQNPSVFYDSSGTYSVNLIAYGAGGSDTLSQNISITIEQLPTVNFTNSSSSICEGDLIDFTNASLNANSYQWSFSGGNPSSSNLQNPSVSYSANGNYNVELIATGNCGSDTSTQTVVVNISQIPIASFYASDTVVSENGIVFFTNSSLYAVSYNWNFGDGNFSTDENPWNQYSDTGYFTVTLIASNGNCPNDTFTVSNYIYVQSNVGIDFEFSDSQFSIYPNPNNGNFNIIAKKEINQFEIKIFNLIGELIYHSQIRTPYSHINISNYSKGVYFLRISSENFLQSVKLIVR